MSDNLPSTQVGTQITDLMPQHWNTSEKTIEAVNAVLNMGNQVTDTYANIPIICKGHECPYFATCELSTLGQDVDDYAGQRCPVEIAKILRKSQGYFDTLQIDPTNMVDVGLVKEIVDAEMIIERINKKMAMDPDITEDVITLINEKTGDVYSRPEVKKIIEFRNIMQNKRDKTLTLLNSTRKDKAETNKSKFSDPLGYYQELLKKAAEMESNTINVTDAGGEGHG